MVRPPTFRERCISCGERLTPTSTGLVLLDKFHCDACSRGILYALAVASDQQEIMATQYEQVNERSRWYATALWQVPTAAVLSLALAIVFVADLDKPRIRGMLLLGLAVFDLLMTYTFFLFSRLAGKATRHLREMEALLSMFPTAIDLTEAKRLLRLPFRPIDQWALWTATLLILALALLGVGAYEVITGR